MFQLQAQRSTKPGGVMPWPSAPADDPPPWRPPISGNEDSEETQLEKLMNSYSSAFDESLVWELQIKSLRKENPAPSLCWAHPHILPPHSFPRVCCLLSSQHLSFLFCPSGHISLSPFFLLSSKAPSTSNFVHKLSLRVWVLDLNSFLPRIQVHWLLNQSPD